MVFHLISSGRSWSFFMDLRRLEVGQCFGDDHDGWMILLWGHQDMKATDGFNLSFFLILIQLHFI